MDEIIIEEKRYISSKQAAKITGYAKDYIGQLCREGRVPARVVGRSWYVLDSAIQDHRFGNPVVESDEKIAPVTETPRYTSPTEEVLPSINQLTAAPKALSNEPIEENNPVEPLQDSWRAWFERVEEAATEAIASSHSVPDEPLAAEEPIEESIEVNVPVRAIHHSLYQPVEEEQLPLVVKSYAHSEEELEEQMPIQEQEYVQRGNRGLVSGIRVASVLVAAISVIVAVMGSGYFDSYIISNKQVSLVAGVSLYNK